jgi:hypothetical protein
MRIPSNVSSGQVAEVPVLRLQLLTPFDGLGRDVRELTIQIGVRQG